MNNKEIQTRREFFRKAAKRMLPIICTIAIFDIPSIAIARARSPMGCDDGCHASCQRNCNRYCRGHVEMIVTQNVKIIVLAVAVEIVKVTVKVIV